MERPLIEIRNLSVRVRQREALQDVRLEAVAGELVAIFGPLGCGKSTLLLAAAGRIPLESGEVRIHGRPVGKRDRRVELVSDAARGSTAHQYVSRAAFGVPMVQRTARITRALEALDLFEERDVPLRDFGRGFRSAVAIAAGFAAAAPVLLIDGLLDTLPEPLFARAWNHLRWRAHSEGTAALIATVKSEIAERADRVLLVGSGTPLAFDTPRALIAAHTAETVTIEAVSSDMVQGTLRGVLDVQIEDSPEGTMFQVADGSGAAAKVFRHPPEGVRTVFVRQPTLWDVFESIRLERTRGERVA